MSEREEREGGGKGGSGGERERESERERGRGRGRGRRGEGEGEGRWRERGTGRTFQALCVVGRWGGMGSWRGWRLNPTNSGSSIAEKDGKTHSHSHNREEGICAEEQISRRYRHLLPCQRVLIIRATRAPAARGRLPTPAAS